MLGGEDAPARPAEPGQGAPAADDYDDLGGRPALTVAQFAKMAGLKRAEVQPMINAGMVLSMSIGGRVLIPADAAREFIASAG
jgi:hypothetical protein